MSGIRLKAILKLTVAGVGIILGVFMLVTKTHAGRISDPNVHTPTAVLTINWTMPERFGAKGTDGITDFHWQATTRSYEKDYVNPAGWKVNFDACSPDVSPGSTFSWNVDGVALPNPNPTSCMFAHEFAKQGTYTVQVIRTAPDQTAAMAQAPVTIKDLLIVSLGDSFASGQGNPDIPKSGSTAARWIDQICARSANAGPAQAALTVEKDDPHTSVTFLSFACSGAEIDAGIINPQTATVKSQIDELRTVLKGRPIDALVISIGGNDIGFSNLVASCILHSRCDTNSDTINKFTEALEQLEARYQRLKESIATLPSVSKVFITQYPDLVRSENEELCDRAPGDDFVLRRIQKKESKWASETVIAGLNRKVEEAAKLHGWTYVTGIADAFRKHGYCAGSENRWVRTFSEARRTQGADGECGVTIVTSFGRIKACLISSGAVHPAEQGHKQGYAPRLVAAFTKEGVIGPPVTPASSMSVSGAKP